MNNQYLQFVREQITIATADLSGATKGQLEAWQENAMFNTGRYRRKKIRYRDKVTGKIVTLDNPPIPGKQSLAKGSSIALVSPVEFSTSSWRRAVLSLEEHHKAWLLWCYSGSICWEHQIAITQWVWNEFKTRSGTRKIAGKTLEHLKKLIWLAAQDVRGWVTGRENYQRQELARVCGIKPDNWSHNYANYWREMCDLFKALDTESLICTVKMRSKQKTTFSRRDIAKVN
ncbi:antiterminator [Escherichia coli]|uniref:bacteriophage antitermination protein Q n=1 Tax=Escherichia coli TaxID=562 RepID=UPI0013026C3C|nr:bacteriophage antitermination protein Q [Escherichia coli]KAE9823122.1 antiterminator [Escherichia coli]MWK17582.1 antiterminator [Escherichia coli]MWK85579.1 antiterminator [Escherichia coli]MWL95980.1 antiterminator [Escherichia coli]HAV9234714.1 antiterminator [Escherichia coli]